MLSYWRGGAGDVCCYQVWTPERGGRGAGRNVRPGRRSAAETAAGCTKMGEETSAELSVVQCTL